jgi:hypothetical protein
MYRDTKDDLDVLVCTVGSTTLLDDARAVDHLHAMLKSYGEWMEVGGADEQKRRSLAQSKLGDAPAITRWAVGMD